MSSQLKNNSLCSANLVIPESLMCQDFKHIEKEMIEKYYTTPSSDYVIKPKVHKSKYHK